MERYKKEREKVFPVCASLREVLKAKKAQRGLNKRGWKKRDLSVKGQKLLLRLAKRVLSVKGDGNYVLGCNINFACRLESWGPESPLN